MAALCPKTGKKASAEQKFSDILGHGGLRWHDLERTWTKVAGKSGHPVSNDPGWLFVGRADHARADLMWRGKVD